MLFERNTIIFYLLNLLGISFFIGKSFKVVAALVVLIFFVDIFKFKKWHIFKDEIFILLSLWCLYLFSSALWAVNFISSMKGSLEVFLWVLFYLAVKNTLTKQEQIKNFIKIQGFVAIFVIVSAFVQFTFGYNFFAIPIEASRVTDPFSNTRLLAYVFPLWIALFGAMLACQQAEKSKNLFYGLVILGLLLTLPLTGSRGPLIILAIFLPLIAWMSPFRKLAFTALGGVLVVTVLIVSVTPQLQARLTTLMHPFENQKHTRIPIWMVAFEQFKDNPLGGVGFRNYRDRQFEYYKDSFESYEINPETGSKAMHAHSPWMDILAEQGIVGALFALGLLFMVAKIAYKMGGIVFIGSMGVWYSFSFLNSGFSLSNGRWSFFMILSVSFFAIIANYEKQKQEAMVNLYKP